MVYCFLDCENLGLFDLLRLHLLSIEPYHCLLNLNIPRTRRVLRVKEQLKLHNSKLPEPQHTPSWADLVTRHLAALDQREWQLFTSMNNTPLVVEEHGLGCLWSEVAYLASSDTDLCLKHRKKKLWFLEFTATAWTLDLVLHHQTLDGFSTHGFHVLHPSLILDQVVSPEAITALTALRAILLKVLKMPRRNKNPLWVNHRSLYLKEPLPADKILFPELLDVAFELGSQVSICCEPAHAAVYLEAGPEEASSFRYLCYCIVFGPWSHGYQNHGC